MIVRHPLCAAVGWIHADSVIAVLTFSDADPGIATRLFVPLKLSAAPYRPLVVHVAPLIVPVLPFPEASATVGPLPSLKPYAATSPVTCAAVVVALATLEYPPRFPAASIARTR